MPRPPMPRKTNHNPSFSPAWLGPRHWPLWLGLGLLWLTTRLPYRAAMALGDGLGRMLYPFSPARRRIALRNLELCFPELSENERVRLAKKNFAYTGRNLIEIAWAWWAPARKITPLATLENKARFQALIDQGRGVILIGMHNTSMDIAARIVTMEFEINPIYQAHDNPVMEHIIRQGRNRHYGDAIPSKDVRGLVRILKQGRVLWYPPDQDHGRRHAVFVPFFGVPAATLTVVSRLARMSGAPVIPIFFYGRDDRSGYDIAFGEPLADFPGDDPAEDASRVNALFEAAIREAPEQYLWVHRRFKTRPNKRDPKLY